jgi:ASC-1-like (ASCH) protein
MKPFFLPLRGVHFDAIASGAKRIEWRSVSPRYRGIVAGRELLLSRGYSGARLLCVVSRVRTCNAKRAPAAARAIYPAAMRLQAIHLREVRSV